MNNFEESLYNPRCVCGNLATHKIEETGEFICDDCAENFLWFHTPGTLTCFKLTSRNENFDYPKEREFTDEELESIESESWFELRHDESA